MSLTIWFLCTCPLLSSEGSCIAHWQSIGCEAQDLSLLNAIADGSLDMTQLLQFFFDTIENILGKGENAGYQYFLLFPQCFQKPSSSGLLKPVFIRSVSRHLKISVFCFIGRFRDE